MCVSHTVSEILSIK